MNTIPIFLGECTDSLNVHDLAESSEGESLDKILLIGYFHDEILSGERIKNPFNLEELETDIRRLQNEKKEYEKKIEAGQDYLRNTNDGYQEQLQKSILNGELNEQSEYHSAATQSVQERILKYQGYLDSNTCKISELTKVKSHAEAINETSDISKKYNTVISLSELRFQITDSRKNDGRKWSPEVQATISREKKYGEELAKMKAIHECRSLGELVNVMNEERMNDFAEFREEEKKYGEYFHSVADDEYTQAIEITSKYGLRDKWQSLRGNS